MYLKNQTILIYKKNSIFDKKKRKVTYKKILLAISKDFTPFEVVSKNIKNIIVVIPKNIKINK